MDILTGIDTFECSSMFTLSPLDSRYKELIKKMLLLYSNPIYYLMRVKVEMAYLEYLLKKYDIDYKLPQIDYNDYNTVKDIYNKCIAHEQVTHHDVKAIEYYIRSIIPEQYHCYIHCGLTSQDVNSVAQTIMIKNATKCISDEYENFVITVNGLIERLKGVPVMTYTHGRPAVSTYFDIDVKKRLIKIQKSFDELINKCNNLTCKFSGSVGNFTTFSLLFKEDEIDTLYSFLNEKLTTETSDKIDFKLKFNNYAFQIDDYNSYSEFISQMSLFFANMKDFAQNLWDRITNDELCQMSVKGEIGSSVMPHKINPVGIEMAKNGAADLGIAECNGISTSLLCSSHSRDISDIFKIRFLGHIFGYALVIMHNISKDVKKLVPNTKVINSIISENVASLSEIIQTRLRIENIGFDAYKVMENLTKGKTITYPELHSFIDELKLKYSLSDKLVDELKSYRIEKPFGYFSHYDKM
jgi:adenylosuccinate lyase